MRALKTATTAFLCLVLAAVCWTPALAAQPDAPAAPAQDLVPAENGQDGTLDDLLIQEPLNQCIQITVWAQNEQTGECQEFSSPCSVPEGWTLYFDPETCTNW
ncbi:MAG: hypothetical protein PVG07_03230 [Acidobacteriota bacterium]|jgi:hypothetical protein